MNEGPLGSALIIHASVFSSFFFHLCHLYLSERPWVVPFCMWLIMCRRTADCACLVVSCWSLTYPGPASLRSSVFTFANHGEMLVRF